MVKQIISFLEQKTPYYFIEEIRNLYNSPCLECDIKVLDFDKVKDEFFKDLEISEHRKLCSVDGIFFNKRNNSLDIFDLKKFNPNAQKTQQQFLNDELVDMPKKLVDSLYILCAIIGYYEMEKALYKILMHPTIIRINSYMVVNVKTSQELMALRNGLQGKLRISISRRMEDNIKLISCQDLQAFFY